MDEANIVSIVRSAAIYLADVTAGEEGLYSTTTLNTSGITMTRSEWASPSTLGGLT